MDFSEPLSAIIDRLRTSAGVTALISATNITNHRPQTDPDTPSGSPADLEMPWVRVQFVPGVNLSAKDFQGFEGEFLLDIWTDKHGDKTVLQIASAINQELHNNPLTLTTTQNVLLQHDQTYPFVEPDGSHHAVQRFRTLNFD